MGFEAKDGVVRPVAENPMFFALNGDDLLSFRGVDVEGAAFNDAGVDAGGGFGASLYV